MRDYNKQDGFTLIEILVVIVVIAVLSGGMIASVSNAVRYQFLSDVDRIANLMMNMYNKSRYNNAVVMCKLIEGKLICNSVRDNKLTLVDFRKEYGIKWPEDIEIQEIQISGKNVSNQEQFFCLFNGIYFIDVSIRLKKIGHEYSVWLNNNPLGQFFTSI